jgi:hypothetical protein
MAEAILSAAELVVHVRSILMAADSSLKSGAAPRA